MDRHSDSSMDGLIKTIAVRHGVAIGRNDPILVLLTVNEELMRANERAMLNLQGKQKEELEAMSKRWADDSTGRAEKFLNIALEATQQSMVKTMTDGATASVDALHRELASALSHVIKQKNQAWQMAVLNIVASIITLAAAFVVVYKGF